MSLHLSNGASGDVGPGRATRKAERRFEKVQHHQLGLDQLATTTALFKHDAPGCTIRNRAWWTIPGRVALGLSPARAAVASFSLSLSFEPDPT